MVSEGRWVRATSCQEKIQVSQSQEEKSEQRAEEEPVQVSEEQQGEEEESGDEVEREQSSGQRGEQGEETAEY